MHIFQDNEPKILDSLTGYEQLNMKRLIYTLGKKFGCFCMLPSDMKLSTNLKIDKKF